MASPSAHRPPKRRVRLRLLPVLGYVVVVLGLAWFFEQRLPTTVIFVRHADVDVATMAIDTPLTERGQQRAVLLADFLEDFDVVAGVNVIYTTDAVRTQQTAAPLAARLNLEPLVADPYAIERFARRILREHRGDIVLIVTDADAIAPLVDEFHGSKRLPVLGPDDFGELYVVTIPFYGGGKTLRMHYGDPPSAASLSGRGGPSFIGTR
jgi:broad specificity phosphatase PhoE